MAQALLPVRVLSRHETIRIRLARAPRTHPHVCNHARASASVNEAMLSGRLAAESLFIDLGEPTNVDEALGS